MFKAFGYDNIKKGILIAVMGLAAAVSVSIPAFAKTINYVRIEQEYQGYIDAINLNEVNFKTYQRDLYDLSFKLLQDNDSYKEGDTLNVEFTLKAHEGYDFEDIKIGSCKVDETIALTEMTLSEDNTLLTLSGELPPLRVGLCQPEGLLLSKTGKASWDPVDKADYYTVTVKSINDRGGLDYRRSCDFTGSSADLRNICFASAGDYIFTVVAKSYRSYLVDSDEAELKRSLSLLVTPDDVGYGSTVWTSGNRAIISGKYVSDACIKICGSWYWFGEDTHLRTGWKDKGGGNWEYYDRESFQRVDGLKEIDGKTFCFDVDTGLMQRGFVNVDGREIFFSENGDAKTGWVYYDGNVYYVRPDGSRNYEQLINHPTGEVYMFDPQDGHLLLAK